MIRKWRNQKEIPTKDNQCYNIGTNIYSKTKYQARKGGQHKTSQTYNLHHGRIVR